MWPDIVRQALECGPVDLIAFDATVDLTPAILPESGNAPPPAIVDSVRAAVEAIPGARWISVQSCAGAPANLPWLTLYRPGRSGAMSGGVWSEIARQVEAAVRAALA